MDFLNNLNKNNNNQQQMSGAPQEQHKGQGGGLLGNLMGGSSGAPQDQVSGSGNSAGSGGLMGKLNNAMGGGAAGEKDEDALDKAVDWVQENVMKAGPQNNESAAEQMKDEAISDAIRDQYKKFSGKDFPIADK